MILVKLIETLQRSMKTVLGVVWAVLALLLVWSLFVHPESAPEPAGEEGGMLASLHSVFEKWPGLWALFGFLGCCVIIYVSKAFGHAGIMVREDYYDE